MTFLTWLLPATNHFPRAHRHTVTRRLLDAAFDLRERLEEANLRHGRPVWNAWHWPMKRWRVCVSICGWRCAGAGFLSGQYEHVATMVARNRSAVGWLAEGHHILRQRQSPGTVVAGAGSQHRVLRGGAFWNNHQNVRCAYRNRNDPHNVNNNVGFRVVVRHTFRCQHCPAGSLHSSGPRRNMAEPVPGRAWMYSGRAYSNRPAPWATPPWCGAPMAAHGQCMRNSVPGTTSCWPITAPARASVGSLLSQPLNTVWKTICWPCRTTLRARTYRPGAYTHFFIHEPKRRLISAAPFRDRVVHHALCNLIEPIFERAFIADSYANRLGKGTHRAFNRAQELARHYPYVLQCDLRQFFPSIDHAIMRTTLARKIADDGVLWLIDRILESGRGVLSEVYDMVYFPGDDLFAALRPRGLPIGNLTSQFWANVYLNPFDHFVKRTLRCQGYVRYVDDMLLFAADKATLWQWKAALQERLATLRLTIHPGAHPRPVDEGIPFLGFTVFPQRRRLKRRKGIHFQRRFWALCTAYSAGDMPLTRVTASVRAWVNHVRYGNTVGLRKAVLRYPLHSTNRRGISNPTSPV